MINTDMEMNQVVENLVKECNTYLENLNNLNEADAKRINEGAWEKIKYGLSKLGRYKAGGKILGKGKIDKASAAQIQLILDKKGNEVIKALDAKIKETNPKFPNNEKEEDFLKTVLEIASVYDSIVASTQKNSNDKGFLPVDAANTVIEDLAQYVKKFLDVDLAAVYTTMDEAKYIDPVFDRGGNVVSTRGGTTPAGGAPTTTGTPPAGGAPAAPTTAKDVRTQLQGKVGAGATTRDSQQMATLKSNKLPLVLAGVGTALGALGWLAQTQWMQNLIMNWLGGGTPAEDAIYKTVSGGAADSQGMVHWMSEINVGQGEAPIKTIGDVNTFIEKYGAENVSHMFDGNGSNLNPMEQVQKLQEIANSNPNASVGEIFKPNSSIFGDMKMGRMTFGISKAASFVAKTLVKQAVKATVGAGAGVAASVAGIGSVLVPLGIGLIATGALVKLLRMKGQKQSRAKTLNDLLQSLQALKGTEENPPVIVKPPAPKLEDEDITTDKLYIILYRFFIYLRKLSEPTSEPTTEPAPVPKPAEEPKVGVDYVPNADRRDYPSQTIPTSYGGWNPSIAESEEEINLDEGRYINNRKMLLAINKQMGNDKVKQFENFLGRVEKIRNVIQKIQPFGIKALDANIKKAQSNPIMGTDFTQIFKSLADNPNQIAVLQKFIDGVLKELSAGKFNVANLIEAIAPTKQPVESDQTLAIFKKNLFSFVASLINIFGQLKTIKASGKKGAKPTAQPQEPVKEMEINEQIKKMNHLAKFIL